MLGAAVFALVAILQGIIAGMHSSTMLGTNVGVIAFPLATLHLIALIRRNALAAAVESFVCFALFLMYLSAIVCIWITSLWGVNNTGGLATLIAVAVLSFITAFAMAAFSEKCKIDRAGRSRRTHCDPSADVATQMARKHKYPKGETPVPLRYFRRTVYCSLAVSFLLYVIGSDDIKGQAVVLFVGSIIGIGVSYLLDRT